MSEEAPRILTDDELRSIVRDEILPILAPQTSVQPRFVVLGGPQGSRKTTLKPVVAGQIGLDDALLLEGDDLLSFHPHYEHLVQELGGTFQASRHIVADHRFMYAETLAAVREQRTSLMVVGPYTDVEYTRARIAEFRHADYRIELAYTALHPALSQLGVMHRHMQTVASGAEAGMLASVELQEKVLKNTPVVMTEVERLGEADALHVVAAEGVVFSKHRQADGSWIPVRRVGEVVIETRARPWSEAVRGDFARRRAVVGTGAGDDWPARLRNVDRLAQQMLRTGTGEAALGQGRDLMSLAFPDSPQEATRGGARSSDGPPADKGPDLGQGIDSGR